MAKTHAYHMENNPYLTSIKDQQRLLLFRVAHAINREQELSGPMVMSYLMGWGDVYRSHTYVPIYWTSFITFLQASFADLHQFSPKEDVTLSRQQESDGGEEEVHKLIKSL